jgi:hypothetical protein
VIEDGICTFTGISYENLYNEPYSAFDYVYFRRPTSTEYNNSNGTGDTANCSLAIGIGNKAYASTYVLGTGNESKGAQQTVIGKNNKIIDGALIIGNGSDLNNRHNAALIDWEGNLKLSGSI